jgi:hypothetical protein
MAHIDHANGGNAALAGAPDTLRDGDAHRRHTKPVSPIDQRRARGSAGQPGLSSGIEHALAHPIEILRQPHGAMRVDTHQIGLDQMGGNLGGDRRATTQRRQKRLRETRQRINGQPRVVLSHPDDLTGRTPPPSASGGH